MVPLVTLTTDFQPDSPYIAQMKGVLYSRLSDVRIVDVTHSVPPQNILFGAYVLADTVPYFPRGTIHIAVVDPGVGSERELICVGFGESEHIAQTVLCPNNGLVSVLARAFPVLSVNLIQNQAFFRESPSVTFHGRDILAPVAAALALGVPVPYLGEALDAEKLVRFPIPEPERTPDGWWGQVLFADSFGNLTTNLTREMVQDPAFVTARTKTFRFVRTYADAPAGSLVALFGSQGRLELAVVNGSAKETIGLAHPEGLIVTCKK
ncbi:MAG: SAM-dependent chlorinase/fluorinase [Thermoguttaceae bacterium]|nr:SAM-dependent chlorinase/fluorinase [Thermoguttaceae bacterium]